MGVEGSVYLSRCTLWVPHISALIEAKSSLASSAQSVISCSNKTKGNGSHFLSELVLSELCAQRRQAMDMLLLSPCSRRVRLPDLLSCPRLQLTKTVSTGLVIYLVTLQRFWVSRLPWRSREFTCYGDKNPQILACVCVTRAGCVSGSHRACSLSLLSLPQLQRRTQNTEQQWKHSSSV